MKYFWYSAKQLEFRKTQEAKMGKTFRVGHVFVGGARKPFTEMTSSNNFRYSDGKLVAAVDTDSVKYTEPTSV